MPVCCFQINYKSMKKKKKIYFLMSNMVREKQNREEAKGREKMLKV